MKITFPFEVAQVGKKEIEVVESEKGRPLVSLEYHPCFDGKLSDELCEKAYIAALVEIVRGTVSVRTEK